MADHGGGHGGGGHGGGHSSGGISPGVAKAIGIGILVIIGYMIFNSFFGTPAIYRQQPSAFGQTERRHGGPERSNAKREEFYRGCRDHNAPVTNRGGGVLNCNNPGGIVTYID